MTIQHNTVGHTPQGPAPSYQSHHNQTIDNHDLRPQGGNSQAYRRGTNPSLGDKKSPTKVANGNGSVQLKYTNGNYGKSGDLANQRLVQGPRVGNGNQM